MRPACRTCMDPVDRDGAEQCDWCAASPEERDAMARRSWIVAIVVIAALIAFEVAVVVAAQGGQ